MGAEDLEERGSEEGSEEGSSWLEMDYGVGDTSLTSALRRTLSWTKEPQDLTVCEQGRESGWAAA